MSFERYCEFNWEELKTKRGAYNFVECLENVYNWCLKNEALIDWDNFLYSLDVELDAMFKDCDFFGLASHWAKINNRLNSIDTVFLPEYHEEHDLKEMRDRLIEYSILKSNLNKAFVKYLDVLKKRYEERLAEEIC